MQLNTWLAFEISVVAGSAVAVVVCSTVLPVKAGAGFRWLWWGQERRLGMSDLTLKIIDVLLPALLALVAAGLAYGAAYLRARAEAIQHGRTQMMTMGILDRAHREVYDAVRATAQTYVDDLKRQREDGKLTKEEAQQARERAWQYFKTHMGAAALVELEAIVGDVVEWFTSEVEAAIGHIKA